MRSAFPKGQQQCRIRDAVWRTVEARFTRCIGTSQISDGDAGGGKATGQPVASAAAHRVK